MPELDGDYDENEYSCGKSLVDTEHQSLFAALYKSRGKVVGMYRFDAVTGEIQNAVISSAIDGYCDSISVALSPDGTRAAVGIKYSYSEADSDSPNPVRLVLADLLSGTCQMVPTAYADVPAVTFISNDQVSVFTTDVIYASSSDRTFPYAVELYNFEDASLVWSSGDEITINREAGQQFLPSYSMQCWHQELGDAGSQDLLVAQFGSQLLLLDLADGHMVQRESFSSDILNSAIYDNRRLFLTLQDGKMVMYLPDSKSRTEIGSISRTLCGACFNPAKEEFLLMANNSQDIVVMSNQLENPDGISIDVDVYSMTYYGHNDREYRILEEQTEKMVDSYTHGDRLLFYTPLSDTPIASTDGNNGMRSFKINFSEDSGAEEDICYYIESADSRYSLCGWGLESNQKVFEYNINDSGEIVGFSGNQILIVGGSISPALILVDPLSKTEQAAVLPNHYRTSTLSPNKKYAAVVTYDSENNSSQLNLVDVENWSWIEVPEELQMQQGTSSGCLSFSSDSSKLAVWMGGEIRILDLNSMTVTQHVQIPCEYNRAGIFLNDHILLVYGDSKRLTTWNVDTQSLVEESVYYNSIDVFIWDRYFQVGEQKSNLYSYDEDGKFACYLSVENGYASPSGSEVLSYYDLYDANNDVKESAVKVYPLYTLDDLVAMATEILDGRTLTEAERNQYLIG